MTAWLRALTSRPAFVLYGGLAAVALVAYLGLLGGWKAKERIEAKPAERAQETDLARKADKRMEQLELAVLALSEAQKALLAKKYDRPELVVVRGENGAPGAPGRDGKDGETKVLNETTTKTAAPAGVSVLTTVDETGKVENTVVANPRPFHEAPMKLRLYGEALFQDTELDFDKADLHLGAEFRVLRLGWFEIQPKVEGFRDQLPDGFFTPDGKSYHDGVRGGLRVTVEW